MNFSKLPKEKRNQLLGVAIATAISLGVLGLGLIQWQYRNLRSLRDQREVNEKKLLRVKDAINRADMIEADYEAKRRLLAEREDAMASGGDLYSWIVDTLQRFKSPYKVDIPQISQPTPPGDVNLLPKFPYKQVTLSVGGTAFYHDFGQFIAGFENHFPHMRAVNLTLEPAPSAAAGEKERLAFTMDIVTLVKPSTP